jgi:hypothetical protein
MIPPQEVVMRVVLVVLALTQGVAWADCETLAEQVRLQEARPVSDEKRRMLDDLQKRLAQCELEHAQRQAAGDPAIMNDPRARLLAWSGFLCGWTADRAAAENEIKQYRKAAKLGGVLNLTEVNNWQEEVMRADRHISAARAALKRMKAKPLPCKNELVTKIAWCSTDDVRAAADCRGVQPYVQISRADE